MTELKIRRFESDYSGVDFMWNPDNPQFATILNAVSIAAMPFERVVVKATREALPLIKDPQIRKEAEGFAAQEAEHTKAHNRHVQALVEQYPGLRDAQGKATDYFDQVLQQGLEFALCFNATLEGTFTSGANLIFDHRESLVGKGDARIASLFLWHVAEEIEHRTSATRIYYDIYGKRFARMKMAPYLVRFLKGFVDLMSEEMAKHVPEADRTSSVNKSPLEGVSKLDLMKVGLGGLASLMPWFDPESEKTHPWAQTLLEAYDAGEDISQFYGRKVAVAAS